MARLPIAIVVALFLALFVGVGGEKKVAKRDSVQLQVVQTDDIFGWLCQNSPLSSYYSWCTTTTAAPKTTTVTKASPTASSPTPSPTTSAGTSSSDMTTSSTYQFESTSSTVVNANNTLSTPTALERAHWCQFSNGSYLPLGQTFMSTSCLMCQCSQTRAIICNTLKCMPTYCIDSATPVTKDGQCCPQCSTDVAPTSCKYNGITFPQGTVVKLMSSNLQCWCQTGSIECRQTATTSTYSNMDYFGNGTAVYVIVIIICALLIFGSILCCGCGVIYYYYYYQRQQTAQEAYEHYYNNGGWQPMAEDGTVLDMNAQQKEAEAQQAQFEQTGPTGQSQEYIPPPYALYNGPYTNGDQEKDQKYV